MIDILEENEKVYRFLESERSQNSKLRYTYRKSNYNNRLSEGYWFYGTDKYLAISFWSGMDWKNRTPNICFIILDNGETFLEINVSDSNTKRKFVDQYLLKPLDLVVQGRKYIKRYSYDELATIDSLDIFLNGFNGQKSDKAKIDEIVAGNPIDIIDGKEDVINLISQDEFRSRQMKVDRYRRLKAEDEAHEQESGIVLNKPNKILEFTIRNYALIKNIKVENIGTSNQWIFFTGQNGSGKTSLLRAIGTVLGYRILKANDLSDKHPFSATLKLYKSGGKPITYTRVLNDENAKISRRPVVQGLAMYGPYRLDVVDEKIGDLNFKNKFRKNESFESLLNSAVPLLNINKQFELWSKSKKERERFEKRMYYIKNMFTDIVPNLHNIKFESQERNKRLTKYVFRDEETEEEKELSWRELSSGTKSVFALVADIMIRLYDQQRHITDPSELSGVVIIDEIDLHLHPRAQKDLVINLTKAFPNVQFLVSTHSPIPLLGAPPESVFIKVEYRKGEVKLFRLEDKIPVNKLLPNALLGSPLFDVDDYAPIDKEINEILTQDNYENALYHYLLKKRFDQFNQKQNDNLEKKGF